VPKTAEIKPIEPEQVMLLRDIHTAQAVMEKLILIIQNID
jgi:hypothetical protein